jgi:hypothetical protein
MMVFYREYPVVFGAGTFNYGNGKTAEGTASSENVVLVKYRE